MWKPFELNLRYLDKESIGLGMYWMTFWWPCPKVTAVTLINKNLLVCRIKSTTQPITTELDSYIPLVIFYHLIRLWRNSVGNFFGANFLWKFRICFFKVKHFIGHISGMVGPIDVKQKRGASVGYWVNQMTLTFDLTLDLDLWFLRSNFKIAVSQELLSDWCETKRKQIN